LKLRYVFAVVFVFFCVGNLIPSENIVCRPVTAYLGEVLAADQSALTMPQISVFPDSLDETLPTGGSSTQTLTIANDGDSDLEINIALITPPGNTMSRINPRPSLHEQQRSSAGALFATGDPSADETAGPPVDYVAGEPQEFTTSIFFEDNFEDGDYSGWVDVGSGSKEVTDLTAAAGSHYSYHEYQSPYGHFDGVYQNLGAIQPGYAGFYVRSGSTTLADGYFVLRNQQGYEAIFFFARSSGFFYVNADVGGDESVPYDAETWYHIEFKNIDFAAKTFDYYVDETLIQTDIPFRYPSSTTNFDRLDIYNFDYQSEAWWDEIVIATEEPAGWLEMDPMTAVIPAGSSFDFDVHFNAARLAGGNYNQWIVIGSNDPMESEVIVPAHLLVIPAPVILAEPDTLSFGEVYVGYTDSLPLLITNRGSDTLIVADIISSVSEFSVDITGLTLPPGKDTVIQVIFFPVAAGSVGGTLAIESNDPTTPTAVVALHGEGLEPPSISVSPSSIADHLFTGGTSAHLLTIDNTAGGSDLNFRIMCERPDATAIRLTPDNPVPVTVGSIIPEGADYAPGRIIIKLNNNIHSWKKSSIQQGLGATVLRNMPLIGVEVWSISGVSVQEAMTLLHDDPSVEYIEPDYRVHMDVIPDDPYFDRLWGMHNTGQTGGVDDADIDAPEAWDQKTGGNVIIGVIDTGVDDDHEDLAENMWVNEGEIPGNGIDDDANGYIDDIHGWDFVNNDNDPSDDNGHGTHCSGTIAGIGDNGIGVAGVCWQAEIMALKFLDAGGSGYSSDAALAVLYAIDNGACLTSNSWGGGPFTQSLYDAIAAAGAANQLFVAAAGNSNVNNDIYPHYPSSYDLDNIIAVAGVDHSDAKYSSSCWGPISVDLAAPAVNVFSCVPGNSYGYKTGTSMACPHVSGACGLLWSAGSALSHYEVRDLILESVDLIPSMEGLVVTGGRLNVNTALENSVSWVMVDMLSGTVPAGTALDLEVIFDATGLATGLYPANVVVVSNDPLNPTVIVPTELSVTSAPDILADPNTLEFEEVYVGFPENRQFYVRNRGADILTVTDIVPDIAEFSVDNPSFTLLPAEEALIEATFAPNSAGPISGTLSIASDDPDTPILYVTLLAEARECPEVAFQPDTLWDTLVNGEMATSILHLVNDGPDVLDFTFPDFAAGVLLSDPSREHNNTAHDFDFLEPEKGDPDLRVGNSVILGAGGPDSSGYRWIDSDESGGPNFSFIDITETGTEVTGFSDDNYRGPFSIGFEFPFYDTSYTEFYIQSNGVINFDPNYITLGNQPIPQADGYDNLLAWCWDDLHPQDGHVYYEQLGTRLIIQFEDYGECCSPTGRVDAEVILYASGTIIYQYDEFRNGFDTGNCTVGIENKDGTDGLEVAFNTAYLHDKLAVRLGRTPDRIVDVSPAVGNIPSGTGLDVEITLLAPARQIEGEYLDSLTIASNDCDNPDTLVYVALQVIGAPVLTTDVDTLDFGDVYVNYSDSLPLTITNDGTDTLKVTTILANLDEFVANVTNFELPPFTDTTIQVTYSPVAVGPQAGHLMILSNDPIQSVAFVKLFGEGLAEPDISISPQSVDDTLAFGETEMHTLAITNNGGSDLEFDLYIPGPVEERLPRINPRSPSDGRNKPAGRHSLTAGDLLDDETAGPPVEIFVPGEPSDITSPLILDDDFEDGDYDGWFVMYGSGIREVTDITAAAGSQYSYHESQSSLGHFDGIYQNLGSVQPRYIGFYIRSGARATSDAYFVLRNSGGEDAIWFFAMGSGNLYVNGDVGGNQSVPYEAETWYQIEFKNIDFAVRTFDYYVNKVLVQSGIPFRYMYGANSFYRVDVYNFDEHSGAWWDEIIIATEEPIGWMTVTPIRGTIPAGSTMDLNVLLDAAGLEAGNYHGEIHLTSNDPDDSEVIVPAHLHVIPAPDIAVDLDSLEFDNVYVGYPEGMPLTIANVGTDTLKVDEIAVDGTAFSVSISDFNLPPGEEFVLRVTFDPPDASHYTGTVSITSNDPDEPVVSVDLSGTGVIPPVIGVTPTELTDSLFLNETSTRFLSIANEGGSDLSIDVHVRSNNVSMALTRATTTHQASSTTHSGGVISTEATDDTPIDPPETPQANEDSRVLIIQNTGAWGVNMYSFLIYYFDVAATVINSGNINVTDFSDFDVIITVGDENSTYYNALSMYVSKFEEFVANGGIVQYQAATKGVGVSIVDGAAVVYGCRDEHNANLCPQHPIMSGLPDTLFGEYANHGYLINLPENAMILTEAVTCALPTTAEYRYGQGTVIATGMTWEYLNLYGYEAGAILYNAVAYVLSLGGIDWLSVEPRQGVIPPGSSMDIAVHFTAENKIGMDYTGEITVNSNDPGELRCVIPTLLHVYPIPAFFLEDNSFDFGDVYIGHPESLSLRIQNPGNGTLSIAEIVSDAAEFSVDPSILDIPPFAEASVEMILDPITPEIIEGVLSIASNDPALPISTVNLTGNARECPEMAFQPETIRDSLYPGQFGALNFFYLRNDGPDVLDFSFPAFAAEALLSDPSLEHNNTVHEFGFLEFEKGDPDPRLGNPVVLGAGGPDSSGYRWIDSDEPGGPVFSFIDITQTGTEITGLSDDSYRGPFPIGFEFPFYDTSYTEFYVQSNGVINFDLRYITLGNQPIPRVDGYNNLLAWCWDDLHPQDGHVYYEQIDNKLIIQFDNYGECCYPAGRVDAEVILDGNGTIVYQYDGFRGGFDTQNCTVGIENAGGTDGLEVAFNTEYLHDGLALRFGRNTMLTGVTPTFGSIASGDSLQVGVALQSVLWAEGEYVSHLELASNDCDQPASLIPINLCVVSCAVVCDISCTWPLMVPPQPDETVDRSQPGTEWQAPDVECSFQVHVLFCLENGIAVGDSAETYVDLNEDGIFTDGERFPARVMSTSGINGTGQAIIDVVMGREMGLKPLPVALYSIGGLPVVDDQGRPVELGRPESNQSEESAQDVDNSQNVWEYNLSANYPNPFNATTIISYTMAEPGAITLKIYDVLGREVKTLVDDSRETGRHSEVWDCTDTHGRPVASGIYFYRLNTKSFSQTKKMVLLK